jgi:ATP-dependent DNA helicase RecG
MPCEGATIEDLDEEAVLKIKKLWAEKTDRQDILKFDVKRLLVGLFGTSKILKATLVLLGKQRSIEKYGINTEITFHYRNNPKNIRSDDRRDFRRCFALEYDEIWNKIDARNEIFYFQKGLFLDQIKKFNESVIREALLNCVAHRDYETEYASSQITIEQSPDKIEFKNPGQLPTDTDLAKLIQTPSKPRNKKLAEVFQKLRLIEKSGFGIDLIVQKTISEGKGSPEYTNFDNHYVFLKLNANLQDEAFIKYLYKIAKEENYTFDAMEVLTLQEILLTGNTNQNNIKENLLRLGFVDNSGAGKGSKLILGKKYYELSGDDVNKFLDQKYDKFDHKDKIRRFIKEFGPKNTNEIIERVKLPVSNRTKNRYLQQLVEEKEIEIVGKQGKIFIYDKKHDN